MEHEEEGHQWNATICELTIKRDSLSRKGSIKYEAAYLHELTGASKPSVSLTPGFVSITPSATTKDWGPSANEILK